MKEDKELEEAIKELKSLSPSETAIKTVLQALEKTKKDYELAIKQNITYKQNIHDLKYNSIPTKKIEDKIKTYERINKERGYLLVRESFLKKELQELLEDK